jgi:hypothetical protein
MKYNLFQFRDIVRINNAVLIQCTLGTQEVFTFTVQEINFRIMQLKREGIPVEQELLAVKEWKRELLRDDWNLVDDELDKLYA